jgi:Mg2+ and Co2+ transporter CorA
VLVHLIAGPNAVVSLHDEPVRGLGDPIDVVAGDSRFGTLSAGTFVILRLEGMLSGFLEEVERIEATIDALDEKALRAPRPADLIEPLVDVRRRVSILRRSLAGQREVFAALTRPFAEDRRALGHRDQSLRPGSSASSSPSTSSGTRCSDPSTT